MIIQGVRITPEQLLRTLNAMQAPEFRAIDIAFAAEANGVPMQHKNRPIAYRLADLLIQRERKAGRIRQTRRGVWITVVDGGK